jgi:hypothetical protein
MANFHLNSQPYLKQLSYNKDTDIILEIGSDQHEGSTEFFNGLSIGTDVPFYSVDVQEESMKRMSHLDSTNWQVDISGSNWTKTVLPGLHKKIKVLYLDNYDWANPGPTADTIKENYAQRNVEWSNLNSQVEHLAQMIGCFPYMAEQSIIICDDTPVVEHHGTYTGKCGAVVPYLLTNGYQIVYAGNNGVILVRGL